MLYQNAIKYGLSADAVGTKQILGFCLPVSAATYLMNVVLSMDMLPDTQIILSVFLFVVSCASEILQRGKDSNKKMQTDFIRCFI